MIGRPDLERSSLAPQAKTDKNDESVNLGILERQLGYLLRRAQLWAFRDFHGTIGSAGLSTIEYCVLIVAKANPGISQTRLGRALEIEKANLARALIALEDRKLLKRTASRADRRSYEITLTERGVRFVALLETPMREHEANLAHALGPKRYDILLRMLHLFAKGHPEDGSPPSG